MATTLKLRDGETAHTALELWEVRNYLQGGSKSGSIDGWLEDTNGNVTSNILISVAAIEYAIKP